MSKLLDLVDLLLGDVLQGNIYSDVTQFKSTLSSQPQPLPENAFGHIPNVDPRNLNFPQKDIHPHAQPPGSKVIPQVPMHDTTNVYSNSSPPQIVRENKRQGFYATNTPPSITQQVASSDNRLADLIDFHERQSAPSSIAAQRVDETIPKTPDQAGPSQIIGTGLEASTTKNEFANSPSRPLNFKGADDAPSRLSLTAQHHPQRNSWNAENIEPSAQRRGIIKDNLYSDSDTLFEGNFQGPFRGPIPQPLNYVNVIATSHWLRNIGKELFSPDIGQGAPGTQEGAGLAERVAKGASFLATQFLLASFNPANLENGGPLNAIWNPLSITAAVPLIGGLASAITAAAVLTPGHQTIVRQLDGAGASRLLQLRKGFYSEVSPVHRLSKVMSPIAAPGFIGDVVGTSGDTLDKQQKDEFPSTLSTIDSQTGGVGERAVRQLGIHTNIYSEDNPYGQKGAVFPLEKVKEASLIGNNPGAEKLATLFNSKSRAGGQVFGFSDQINAGIDQPQKALFGEFITKNITDVNNIGFSQDHLADAPGINAAVVPAGLPGETTVDPPTGGSTKKAKGTVETPIPDGKVYMPFMFQDLRDNTSTFLYFRAFLKGDINETFTPDWDTSRYYGRVDLVPIYKGTSRQLSFSFDIVAMQPSDLRIIYFKLSKLQSMVYPTYDLRGFMEAGPIIRMRIGDLFAGQGGGADGVARGLPGYIFGMDFSFPDGIWEIDKDFKVPRLITVSMTFVVVHDGNPGIYKKENWEIDTTQTAADPTAEQDLDASPQDGVFGAGKFNRETDVTSVTVSRAEVRRIFSTIRNQTNN